MNRTIRNLFRPLGAAVAVLMLAVAAPARAVIDGLTGSAFTLTAKADYISSADGNSHFAWGYANGAGRMQYPGRR